MGGRQTLVAMAVLDEIRGRLAEVFARRTTRSITWFTAQASAAVYGAMLGASVDQISRRSAVLAHLHSVSCHPPRPSAFGFQRGVGSISTEVAVLSMRRAMRGFIGPPTSFATRKPSSACSNPQQADTSPFDLALATAGTISP
jgi:2-methylcitrate dehydratase